MNDTFLLSKWIDENIPKKYRQRGLLIWEDCPLPLVERVREAFDLGAQVERDKLIDQIRDYEIKVLALNTVLEAKNETVVHIKQINWPIVLLAVILVAIEVWRFFHV